MTVASPRHCDAEDTAALLPFASLTAAIARAAIDKDEGRIDCPPRGVVALPDGATMLSMPAVAADLAIHKLITVTPRNRDRGQPTIQGAVTSIDPTTGRPLLVLDGPTVTARRTAAVTLCAIEALGSPTDATALVIGTGNQARHHVLALAALRPAWRIRMRGTSSARALDFCATLDAHALDLEPDEGDPVEVVITCTNSATPVYEAPERDAPRLIVAVGSFRPTIAEIAANTVAARACFVDDLEGARHEAGDLLCAGVRWDTVGTLAQLVRGATPPASPVLFKSVGCAAWDLAAVRVAMDALRA
jgi:1-piperideine-2-carboxylate/1-pyrroline-2-carboxylate reductase [NAD(P)H]